MKSSQGREAYAIREMVDHVAPLRGLYAPFANLPPGMVGTVDCEGPHYPSPQEKGPPPRSIWRAIFWESGNLSIMASWAVSIGYRARGTRRAVLPRRRTIWRHYCARLDRVYFVLAHAARCGGWPLKKMGVGDACAYFFVVLCVCYSGAFSS